MTNPVLASPGKVKPVILCQAAASYQATLPAALFRAGMLRRVICSVPELQILEPTAAGDLEIVKRYLLYKACRAFLWRAWGALARQTKPQLPIVATSWLAGRLLAPWVAEDSIFHGLPGLMLPALRAREGCLTSLLENASLHARCWQREVRHECAQAGMEPGRCAATLPPALIRRLEREYELCDAIIVPSTTARRSFAEFGLGHKTHIVWPGVDSDFFSPSQEPSPSSAFRVCFVGRIELAKGIMYLLQAWKLLALRNAELVLVGPVQPHIRSILSHYSRSNIVLTGALPPRQVVQQYRSAHVFLHPSANE
ncbi:MAG TPA: glycosyltransferase family 4 protein, partial [Terriglobales bacterium]|nr:glycosyltransferase family 4 protein [Terriglobales bacterium]